MEDSNLQHLKDIYKACETVINRLIKFEPVCERFVSRCVVNNSSSNELEAFELKIRHFIVLLNILNLEFNKYFEPFPYQHPWFQENEMQILTVFVEIVRLHDLLHTLLRALLGKKFDILMESRDVKVSSEKLASSVEHPTKSKSPVEDKSLTKLISSAESAKINRSSRKSKSPTENKSLIKLPSTESTKINGCPRKHKSPIQSKYPRKFPSTESTERNGCSRKSKTPIQSKSPAKFPSTESTERNGCSRKSKSPMQSKSPTKFHSTESIKRNGHSRKSKSPIQNKSPIKFMPPTESIKRNEYLRKSKYPIQNKSPTKLPTVESTRTSKPSELLRALLNMPSTKE